MISALPEIEGVNIVFVGSFNPTIYQPKWFELESLFTEKEADSAKIEIIHRDMVIFEIEWLRIEATGDRFIMKTKSEPFEKLRDLGSSIFKILNHTPITQMGINSNAHFTMKTDEALSTLLSTLSPWTVWNKILEKPKFLGLKLRDNNRNDGLTGHTNIEVAPSNLLYPNPGICIQINDHFEVKYPEKTHNCVEIIEILDEQWMISRERARKIMNSILES